MICSYKIFTLMKMEEIIKLRKLYGLKKVYRANSVENRKESSAEHSWSCLILADYFLNITDIKLDRLKVYELLMYHDVIEIEAGDTPLHKEEERKNQREKELKALNKLKHEIPRELKTKFVNLVNEFEENKTKEAKFAQAIDKLDAQIHELDYKKDWKGWTEEFLRAEKEIYFKEFPKIKQAFEKITDYARENGYFDQRKWKFF